MKTPALAFLFLLTSTLLLAQVPDTTRATRYKAPAQAAMPHTDPLVLLNQLNQLQNQSNINTQIRLVDNRYEGLRGTPYLIPTWSTGEIELVNGKIYASVPLKFDASSQNLVVLRPPANDSIVVYANQIKQFAFQDAAGNTFLFRRYPDAKTDDVALKEGYFQVLQGGKNTLLKRTGKTIRKADYKQAYSSDIRFDAYQDDVTYYLLRPDQSLVRLKRNRKSIFEGVGGDETALKAFADREKLSFKTDADMAKLVQFANSL